MLYTTNSYGDISGELAGEYQQKNTNTVLHVVKYLKDVRIINNDDCVRAGFANVCEATGLMGRWQTIGKSPLVVCDTGHNVGGWQYLSSQIKSVECKALRIVFGMVDDKDIEHVMDMLPKNAVYYFAQATTHRAIPVSVVGEKASAHGLHGTCYTSVDEAYEHALADADKADFVFVGGSSYVVADLLTYLKNNN